MKHVLNYGEATAIVEDTGAELVSYHNDIEYLWQGDPKYWEGHSPILFPNPSVLMDGKIRIAGKEYALEKHGFVRGKQFLVEEKGESYIILSYTANEETLAVYPFNFKLFVTHEITDKGFISRFKVVNQDEKTMYFCIGGHPSFNCPMYAGEDFEDYDLRFSEVENTLAYYTYNYQYMDRDLYWHRLKNSDTWQLQNSDFAIDSSIFENLKSKYVSLVNRRTGKGIRMYIGDFPALVVWKKEGTDAPYLCIEPWQGIPAVKGESGNFEDKPYAIKLLAGESYDGHYSVEILQ